TSKRDWSSDVCSSDLNRPRSRRAAVANAVGMAMAARRERGLFDPDTPEGQSPFDHHIYVVASDGDLQEGISSEASSLAGLQQLEIGRASCRGRGASGR